MEWVNDAGFDTLLVRLPGFKQQQVIENSRSMERAIRETINSSVLTLFHQIMILILIKSVQSLRVEYFLSNTQRRISVQPYRLNTEDGTSGQDSATQEVPPKTQAETSGNNDGRANATSTEANLKCVKRLTS
ncbi:hypothetical protein OIU74_004217 [Salix koriyanagi]|uniref:Uncharacterized protein n=1 Tax=Salix koriyanagi TaxID=2511006 RepID=A0A9Q0ZM61_9ROSI|nr:hypothetical protein OIU74_004217 [Salix koriyanagi]